MTLQRAVPASLSTRQDKLLARQAVEVLEAAGAPLSATALTLQISGRALAEGANGHNGQDGSHPSPSASRAGVPPYLVKRLESTLARDERFVRDAAGMWGLASWLRAGEGPSPLLAEYAVLDATLPVGRRDHAVRLAGVRLRAGQMVDPYYVRFVPSETPAGATGATLALPSPAGGAGAPLAQGEAGRPVVEVLTEIREWLGDAVLVGQNVAAVAALLNAQAATVRQPLFENRILELANLALLLLPGTRRTSLSRLAEALGVAPRLRHPALGDARLVADVLLAVLRRLDVRQPAANDSSLFGWLSGGPSEGGVPGGGPGAAGGGKGVAGGVWPPGPAGTALAGPAPAGLAGAPSAGPGPGGSGVAPAATPVTAPVTAPAATPRTGAVPAAAPLRIERGASGLAEETREALPMVPGVYVFRDDGGRALFVGTAESLRDQIAAHFTVDPERGEPDAPWAGRAAAVEHTAVDCELDAMLLAAERTRAVHPAFRSRGARRYSPVLRFVGGVFLRAEPGHAVDGGETILFGPYRSEAELRQTVQTVRRVFQIRTCSRRLPARRPAMRIPCERLAQGLCPAPCADLVSPEQYNVLVELAHLFVSAGKRATLDAIDARLEALAGDGQSDPWESAILAECRARLSRVRKEYRPLSGGFGGGGVVMTYPTGDGRLAVFYVQDGRFVARFRVSPEDAADGKLLPAVEAQLAGQGPPAPLDMAQLNVLLRWLFQHAGQRELRTAPAVSGTHDLAGFVVDAIRQQISPESAT